MLTRFVLEGICVSWIGVSCAVSISNEMHHHTKNLQEIQSDRDLAKHGRCVLLAVNNH